MWELEELLPTLAVAEVREWLGGVGEELGEVGEGLGDLASSSLKQESWVFVHVTLRRLPGRSMISASSTVTQSIAVFRECTGACEQLSLRSR